MNFEARSFPGQFVRPTPKCWVSENDGLLIIATPWGNSESVDKIIENLSRIILAAQQDSEITSPFERSLQLSKTANDIRTAALITNRMTFTNENKDQFKSGFELSIVYQQGYECSWLQIGNPNLFLMRQNQKVAPLSVSMDLSFELHTAGVALSPLPNRLLGLGSDLEFNIGTFRPQEDDQIIALSHQNMPTTILNPKFSLQSLDELAAQISSEDPVAPFWIGRATL